MPDHGGYRQPVGLAAPGRRCLRGAGARSRRGRWLAWRAARDALFRPPHPAIDPPIGRLRAACRSSRYDPALRFAVPLAPADGAPIARCRRRGRRVRLQPVRDDGRARAGRWARELTLFWIAGYGGGVFLPFTDATSGRKSYGGGRYLLDTIKGADLGTDADGRTVLDFNYAYNPSCSYSDRYVCPLAPPENRLAGGDESAPASVSARPCACVARLGLGRRQGRGHRACQAFSCRTRCEPRASIARDLALTLLRPGASPRRSVRKRSCRRSFALKTERTFPRVA